MHACRAVLAARRAVLSSSAASAGDRRQRIEGRDDGARWRWSARTGGRTAGQAADEGDRHEDGAQHQRDGDDRAGHLAHRLAAWPRAARRPASMLRSTFSTTTMASSTTMPMASTRPNSDSALMEKPKQIHDREGADDGDRHRQQRNDRGAPGLQEQDHDEDDQRDRFQQRVHHGLDRVAHEHGRVVDDRCSRCPAGKFFFSSSIVARTCVGDLRWRWSPAPGRSGWRPPACCRAASAAP